MSAEHRRLDSRAKTGSAKSFTAAPAAQVVGASSLRAAVLKIQIPDVTPASARKYAARGAAELAADDSVAVTRAQQRFSDGETPAADAAPGRWTDFFFQPQAALAGVVFLATVLAGVVVLGLRGGDKQAPPADATDNGTQARQSDPADDIPRAALRSNVFPVEETGVEQPPGNQTSFWNRSGDYLQTAPYNAESTEQAVPNRSISVGNGPLAGLEAADSGPIRPNVGAALAGPREQQGVAKLKGILQHQIMAEATNERDRPGLR